MESIKIEKEKRLELSSLVLLEYIFRTGKTYSVDLVGNDEYLKNFLDFLVSKRYLKIIDRGYLISKKGLEICNVIQRRINDFIRRYDILRAVDTNTGEFAFSSIFDYDKDISPVSQTSPWEDFLDQNNWHDLILASAEFHKIDLIDMAFIAFLVDEEFDTENSTWEFDLHLGEILNKMEQKINNRIRLDKLGYSTMDQNAFMSDLLLESNVVMQWISDVEADRYENEYVKYDVILDDNSDNDYYYHYTDSFYVSECWKV